MPTLPGIKDKFSKPPKFWAMVQSTNSCQFSPAPALIMHSFSSVISMPLMLYLITKPLKLFVKRILLPPPRIKISLWFFNYEANSSLE